ncbi:Angiopoietin-related protein 3 [Oryzias melastigma]|uniref:Angiopoietin-related protein 3 n=1 Tax=Oryzias melastigma TaxID=30732 RepID=A0A834C3K9_ORYME|nr:Angiopoietin-related protein 3 [Oryzias melastigma]
MEDIPLLANGLLQLGQRMRDFVQKTKGQINDIFKKLSNFDRSFSQLSTLTSKIEEEEEELKKRMVVLTTHTEEIMYLSEESSAKMQSILQERDQLQSKVERLEEKLSIQSLGLMTDMQVAEINSLRSVIYSQEESITALLEAMKEQNDQLFNQRTKIKILEDKLTNYTSVQNTLEKKDVLNSEGYFEPQKSHRNLVPPGKE